MDSTKPSRSRRIVIALLFPLLFLLTACEMSMEVNVHEDDTASTTMLMAVPKDESLGLGDLSCDQLAAEAKQQAGGDDVTVEDQSDDQNIRCKISGKPEPIDKMNNEGFTIKRDGDQFVVHIEQDPSMQDMGMLGGAFKVEVAFHFPGPVQEVNTSLPDDAYTISGNSVTFTSIDVFAAETTITADAGSGGSAMWWILGVVIVLIILAIIAVVVMKKKKSASPAQGAANVDAAPPVAPGNVYGAPGNPTGQPDGNFTPPANAAGYPPATGAPNTSEDGSQLPPMPQPPQTGDQPPYPGQGSQNGDQRPPSQT